LIYWSLRVRIAPSRGAAGRAEETLLIEWPENEAAPTKYWLSNLDSKISFRARDEGTRGQVSVVVGLSESGSVHSVDVAKEMPSSTGQPSMPPAGMTDAQRNYVVRFDFK
jgi:outer membrane biosynthesis protein TonB